MGEDFLSLLVFFVAGGIASADATKGLSARPLDPFGADTPMQLCALWKPSASMFLDFPPIKKGDLFPAEAISRKSSLFYSLLISPTGAFP